MDKSEIILYDLPSKARCACWSLNPWKTRLVLNYKSLDYKTEWTEYPDLKKVIGPHLGDSSLELYTSPTIRLPDGQYVMDSWPIAQRLEDLYPERPLDLSWSGTDKIKTATVAIWATIKADVVYKIATQLLNPASQPYFLSTRETRFGMPLDRFEAERGGQKCYDDASHLVKEVGDYLRENKAGPFFQGDKVSYADFIWVGLLQCVRRVGDSYLDKLLASDPEPHRALLEACAQWLARDDR